VFQIRGDNVVVEPAPVDQVSRNTVRSHRPAVATSSTASQILSCPSVTSATGCSSYGESCHHRQVRQRLARGVRDDVVEAAMFGDPFSWA
jgi:hypothetical protein